MSEEFDLLLKKLVPGQARLLLRSIGMDAPYNLTVGADC